MVKQRRLQILYKLKRSSIQPNGELERGKKGVKGSFYINLTNSHPKQRSPELSMDRLGVRRIQIHAN